jgi:predicted glycogen debranching enzyme
VRIDDDGLLAAGDGTTPVTWMDARRDGVTFTPREGKAVELNALWLNGLVCLADLVERGGDGAGADALRGAATTAGAAFRAAFWWPERGCLHDRLVETGDGWRPDGMLRPNQVFAVSLPHSPLSREQQRGVVAALRNELLTPYGLRTLERSHPSYAGRYEGDLVARDAAYHNGTVWPWLIGPYVDGLLRTGGDGDEARAALAPLLAELDRGCLHQLAEVYDGDAPHRASGCPAQAWSVAEVRRVAERLDLRA